MSGFTVRDGTPVFGLTWTKAGSWHARGCACPGEFEQFERYHLAPAGIRVVPHPSTAVLACTWDGITVPRRGAPYAAVQAASTPLFRALRQPLSRNEVRALGQDR